MSINVLHYVSLQLILMILFCLDQNVNGFNTFGLLGVRSHLSTLRQQRLPFVCDVVLHAARRRRVDDDTPANRNTSNPTLRGTRRTNFGQTPRSWMENYEALLEYKRLHQHCRVPQRYSPDRALGSWVSGLRLNGREKVSLEQLELLDKAGFDWESKDERNNRLWQESYQKLLEYKEVYGDCCVPKRYKKGKALGEWVNTQRKLQKQDRLRMDRREQLDAIGFTWSVNDSPSHVNTTHVDRLWNETFDRLLEFREEWGHCSVPDYFEEDPSLGKWVTTQRSMFRSGHLRPDRMKRLEKVGFEFDPTNTKQNLHDRHWNVMFQHLVDYKAAHGDTNVKKRHEEHGLGRWVHWQRQNENVMDAERRKRLDEIGFRWSIRPKPRSWQEAFEHLREHSALHRTCRVKMNDNRRLAKWVFKQRYRIKRGELSEGKIKQLKSIGFE